MNNIISFFKKKRVVISVLIICVLLFIIICFVIVLKKGTFGYDLDGDKLVIDCPELVHSGESVSCDIYLEMVDEVNISGVQAVYDFDEELTFQSFELDSTKCSGESCFSSYNADDGSFRVASNDEVSGGGFVGTISFLMPNNISPNTEFKVGFKNIQIYYLVYGGGEVGLTPVLIDLNDAETTVRTPEAIATLSSLSLVNGEETISVPSFSPINLNYTLNVASSVSSISFSYETTGEHATVSGSGIASPISLDYGNNQLEFVVYAEDAETHLKYTVNVFREYSFVSEVYNYIDEYNIIYTGPDTDSQIVSKLADLSDGVRYSLDLEENKLYILREDDSVVSEINVLRFGVGYSIYDNNFYLDGPLVYSELLDTIHDDNISIELYNYDNVLQEDTSTMITEGDSLKVYYNEELLASYEFVDNSLGFASGLVRDDVNNIINRVPADITVAQFKNLITVNGEISVFNLSNELAEETDVVCTGYTVSINMQNETLTYTISVLGDINGDGLIYINDIGMIYRYYMGYLRTLSRAQVNAGDIINDGEIYINDIGRLYRYYMNYESSLEVVENE